MKSEKRSHPRLKPTNIKADVFSTHPSAQEISLNAEIIDISQTGIRIKLKKPLDTSLHEKLEITMLSPESGTPFTVHGTLKHLHSETEIGLHYTDHVNGSVDDMLFECIKINDSTLLIKSQ
jgi:hypothetical protein